MIKWLLLTFSSLERRLTNAILFSKIGDIVDDKIAPYDFFNTQIYLDNANYVKFNLSLNRNAQIGFYAEKNSPPTFTKFKYFENFDANTLVTRAQVRVYFGLFSENSSNKIKIFNRK
jgi:hypothetical protein